MGPGLESVEWPLDGRIEITQHLLPANPLRELQPGRIDVLIGGSTRSRQTAPIFPDTEVESIGSPFPSGFTSTRIMAQSAPARAVPLMVAFLGEISTDQTSFGF
jgi:hypothetical protein